MDLRAFLFFCTYQVVNMMNGHRLTKGIFEEGAEGVKFI